MFNKMFNKKTSPINCAELMKHFPHVIENEFEKRKIAGFVRFEIAGYTYVSFVNSKGEKELAKFWRMCGSLYCYSFFAEGINKD